VTLADVPGQAPVIQTSVASAEEPFAVPYVGNNSLSWSIRDMRGNVEGKERLGHGLILR
jgi:hypothetical protein